MRGRIKIHGPIGVALFCLAAVMLGQGQEPFTTYFYSFAWWSYIMIADALVYWMRGESLIINRTRTFLLMIPLSIFVWCIFEGFNFRLANWHYIPSPLKLGSGGSAMPWPMGQSCQACARQRTSSKKPGSLDLHFGDDGGLLAYPCIL